MGIPGEKTSIQFREQRCNRDKTKTLYLSNYQKTTFILEYTSKIKKPFLFTNLNFYTGLSNLYRKKMLAQYFLRVAIPF